MTSRKITETLGSVADNLESTWNRLVMGVRTRHMPKSIKKVKKTLQGKQDYDGMNLGLNIEEHNMDISEKVTFSPKYMGSTLVEELVNTEPGANYYNTGSNTRALDRIVKTTRSNNLVQVSLNITGKEVQVVRLEDRTSILNIPWAKVLFCCHDRKYSKVASYICRNTDSNTVECHAFLCERQKMAKAITESIERMYCKVKSHAQQQHKEKEDNPTVVDDIGGNFTNNVSEQDQSSPVISQPEQTATGIGEDDLLGDLGQVDKPVIMRKKSTRRDSLTVAGPLIIEDDLIQPVTRERADSDSWAVMAGGSTHDSTNVDLELEFSKPNSKADLMWPCPTCYSNNVPARSSLWFQTQIASFARSRSQANLTDLHTSVYSGWDI